MRTVSRQANAIRARVIKANTNKLEAARLFNNSYWLRKIACELCSTITIPSTLFPSRIGWPAITIFTFLSTERRVSDRGFPPRTSMIISSRRTVISEGRSSNTTSGRRNSASRRVEISFCSFCHRVTGASSGSSTARGGVKPPTTARTCCCLSITQIRELG